MTFPHFFVPPFDPRVTEGKARHCGTGKKSADDVKMSSLPLSASAPACSSKSHFSASIAATFQAFRARSCGAAERRKSIIADIIGQGSTAVKLSLRKSGWRRSGADDVDEADDSTGDGDGDCFGGKSSSPASSLSLFRPLRLRSRSKSPFLFDACMGRMCTRAISVVRAVSSLARDEAHVWKVNGVYT